MRLRTEQTVGDELRRRLEPVLHEEVQVVALVEHLDVHLGIQLREPARLAVLLGDQLLVQRGDLDVEVVRREVEVRAERLRRVAVAVGFEHERARLVLPVDGVEVEELRELPFGVVREPHLLVRQRSEMSQPPGCAVARRRARRIAGVELLHHLTERHDVEHALAAAHEVDQRVVGAREHRVGAVEHEARGGPVVAEVFAQVVDRLARGLQLHARVEQALHDLEPHEIASTSSVRCVPLPRASAIDGRTRSVRAQ